MRKNRFVVLLILFLAGFMFFFFVTKHDEAVDTIFDEIYVDEMRFLRSNTKTGTRLARIEGADLITEKESSDFQSGLVLVTYQSKQFPDRSNLNIIASDKDRLILDFEESLADDVQLSLIDTYDVSKKELVRTIKISDYTTESIEIPQSAYETYFKKYGLHKEKIQKRFSLFEQALLSEWILVYDSQFSPENWGNVKVIDNW
ncbi:TipC family immunity protein [Streptococcus rifensis]